MSLTGAVLMVFLAGDCRVIDGETWRCRGERLRLEKIDSPEMSEPGGPEAKEHMRLLIEGKRVTCEIRSRDYYGRLLGRCRRHCAGRVHRRQGGARQDSEDADHGRPR